MKRYTHPVLIAVVFFIVGVAPTIAGELLPKQSALGNPRHAPERERFNDEDRGTILGGATGAAVALAVGKKYIVPLTLIGGAFGSMQGSRSMANEAEQHAGDYYCIERYASRTDPVTGKNRAQNAQNCSREGWKKGDEQKIVAPGQATYGEYDLPMADPNPGSEPASRLDSPPAASSVAVARATYATECQRFKVDGTLDRNCPN